MMKLKPGLLPALICLATLAFPVSGFAQKKKGNDPSTVKWKIDTVVRGITIPFGMAFLPGGDMLVTDRSEGKIYRVSGKQKQLIGNLPEVHAKDQGGMMDIVLHPDYPTNPWIYFSYSAIREGKNGTVVERAKLEGKNLAARQVLFSAHPFYTNGAHYGCRLALRDGYLYITIGERYSLKDSAQTLGNHLGKVLRLKEDGTVPSDNPFVNRPGALPQIWTYGHRNPQGLAFHPSTGELWEGEHGPKGGDELNLLEPGKNYGWPVITYGAD
jgi:glucose/arabinose dehydrogenase